MQRAILGHSERTHSRSVALAWVPAGVAVLILGSQIAPNSHEFSHSRAGTYASEKLAMMNPVAEAHASLVEAPADTFGEDSDPAIAGDLIEAEVFAAELLADTNAPSVTPPVAPPLDVNESKAPAQPVTEPLAQLPSTENLEVLHIRRGDSLSSLLSKAGVDARDWLAVARMGGDARRLRSIQPGQTLEISRNGEALQTLQYALTPLQTLIIERDGEGFTQRVYERPTDYRTRELAATIDSSMYVAALNAGMSDRLIMQFAEIFAWDIDFSRDVREGDQLKVIFDEPIDTDTGEVLGRPIIIAAEYKQTSRTFTAVRFEPADEYPGYFSADGRPLRKAFLRTPVDFTRISSRYSNGRKHPILNKVRAHKGVDYAARHGTPIRATGDGRVAFADTKGGYGRTVIIRHNGMYETLYAHMSRYGDGIRSGAPIKQGQIIGYVGSSGLATGPHLHYEFHVNGKHTDPLNVRLPAAAPLPASELARFHGHAEPLLAQLESVPLAPQVAQVTP